MKVDDDAHGLKSERLDKQTINQEKKSKEDMSALRIALMQQHKYTRTTLRRETKD